MLLDKWQEDFIATAGDKILCTGRQVGKSVICAIDAAEYALHNNNQFILMIAPTERQAYSLYEKTLDYLLENYPKEIKKGIDRPTQTKFVLRNETQVYCLPTGINGIGIRGYTVNRLYVDEASRIPEDVWNAVTPMLLTTGGATILLSTPAGEDGYFWNVWINKDEAFNSYSRFYANSEEVIKNRLLSQSWTEQQREKAIEHLNREMARMTTLQYAQEYLGKFVNSLRQFFPTDIILSAMTVTADSAIPHLSVSGRSDNFLGVDVAGMGSDQTVLFSLARINKQRLIQLDMQVTEKTLLTDTINRIKIADKQHNYKKIYIDDGGIGFGVFSALFEDEQTKRKVVAINNSARAIDRQEKKKKILKEDLYNNLLVLMEQGKVKLKDDPEIFQSLKSVQYEYENGRFRIFGNYTHITEALIRAAWCMKDKSLNIWVAFQ